METPYPARASFNDTFTGLDVVIPARRSAFVIGFISLWLCGWVMGEMFAISAVSGIGAPDFAKTFLLFWLAGWTIGGFFAIRLLLWNLMGKEIISFIPGQITLAKKGLLFSRSKTYDLNEAKRFRAQGDDIVYQSGWGTRNNGLFKFDRGTIRFDYGMKTVKFAIDMEEAEAKYILQELRNRKLLTDANF